MTFAAHSLPPSDRDEAPTIVLRRRFPHDVPAESDFWLGISHDIFLLGLDSKQLRDAFTHALRCSAERKPDQLRLAIAAIRTRAEAIERKAAQVEKTLSDGVKK